MRYVFFFYIFVSFLAADTRCIAALYRTSAISAASCRQERHGALRCMRLIPICSCEISREKSRVWSTFHRYACSNYDRPLMAFMLSKLLPSWTRHQSRVTGLQHESDGHEIRCATWSRGICWLVIHICIPVMRCRSGSKSLRWRAPRYRSA